MTEEDGREFIKSAALEVWRNPFKPFESRSDQKKRQKEERHRREQALLNITVNASSVSPSSPAATQRETKETKPQLISHFVMNLPDSALEFLDAYTGCFNSLLDEPNFSKEDAIMPLIHVHCFTRELERELASSDICQVWLSHF